MGEKFAKTIKMTYLCTENKNVNLSHGTKNQETKKDKNSPRRHRPAGVRRYSTGGCRSSTVDGL